MDPGKDKVWQGEGTSLGHNPIGSTPTRPFSPGEQIFLIQRSTVILGDIHTPPGDWETCNKTDNPKDFLLLICS